MTGPSVLVIDNYDSFAYNLVQYVGEIVSEDDRRESSDKVSGEGRPASREDDRRESLNKASGDEGATSREDDRRESSDKVSGEGRPASREDDGEVIVRRNDAIDIEGIRKLDPDAIVISPGPGTPEQAGVSMPIFEQLSIPTLGVCLGHQALCAVHGAPVGHAPGVVHGKPSTITHDGRGIFEGLPTAFEVGRYHSLGVERTALPGCLAETARTDDERSIVMAVRHESQPHVGVQFHPESILTDHGKQLLASFFREYA